MKKLNDIEYLTDEQLQQLIAEVEEDTVFAPDYFKQTILNKVPEKKQFTAYNVRIAAAAAVVLIILFALPNREWQTNHTNSETHWRQENFIVKNINETTNDFCSVISEKTNQLFQKEEW